MTAVEKDEQNINPTPKADEALPKIPDACKPALIAAGTAIAKSFNSVGSEQVLQHPDAALDAVKNASMTEVEELFDCLQKNHFLPNGPKGKREI